MCKPLQAATAAFLLSGCSAVDHGESGQLADVGTTVVGLSEGFVEGNAAWPIALPIKAVANQQAELLVVEDCNRVKRALSTAGWGAAGANVATLAIGSFTAASAGAGLIAGLTAYKLYTKSKGCTETDKLAAFEKRWQLAKKNREFYEWITE